MELVTCLVRRSLRVSHAKISQMMHQDFCRYHRLALAGHEACIWTLGGKASDFRNPEDYARVTHDFPLALAEGKRFTSGTLTWAASQLRN